MTDPSDNDMICFGPEDAPMPWSQPAVYGKPEVNEPVESSPNGRGSENG